MKIICIGRNYADHAKELKNDIPSKPLFFMKPDTALLKDSEFYHPDFSKDIHHEVELVVKISKVGKHISEKFADKYYSEIGLGIDFTARDLQQECKEKGQPWEIAKSFDGSAPISTDFISIENLNLDDMNFSLFKNGELVQKGSTKDMIFNINQIISYVSQFVTLKMGDLIYTGTPAGVSKIQIGDKLEGFIEEKKMLTLEIK